MQRLVLDFLGRYWWIIALIALVSMLGIAFGQPLVFTPFLVAALVFDAGRGLIRVVRPLPMRREEQAGAWWIIGVLLAPLVTVAANPIGALIYQATHKAPMIPLSPDYFAPWFAAGAAAWLGLGYAAFTFLLCIALPTRPANNLLGTIWQGIVGMLWGVSMSGPMLLMFITPKNPGAVAPWHWFIFALVPVLVVLSFRAAPEMADRRMFALRAGQKPAAAPVGTDRGGLTGLPLFLTLVIGRTLLLFVLMWAVMIVSLTFLGVGVHAGGSMAAPQLVVFVIMLGTMAVKMSNMRVLRTLPLSTARLAMVLLAVPMALAIACAALLTFAGGASDPSLSASLNFLARVVTVAGLGGLALAGSLHVAAGMRIVALVVFVMAATFVVIYFAKIALWLLPGGAACLVASYFLLVRGLRKSSALYQPATLFGVIPGQSLSAR